MKEFALELFAGGAEYVILKKGDKGCEGACRRSVPWREPDRVARTKSGIGPLPREARTDKGP